MMRHRGYRSHAHRRRVGGRLLVGAVATLAAVSVAGAGATTPLSLGAPGVASVLAHYTTTNNQANATLSARTLAEVEGGTALTLDSSGYVFDRRAGFTSIDGLRYYDLTIGADQAAVPTSSSYPLSFVALVV